MACPSVEDGHFCVFFKQNLSLYFTGFDPKEPVSLLALFLFTSSRAVCLRGREVLLAGFRCYILGAGSSVEGSSRRVPLEKLISQLNTTYSFSAKGVKRGDESHLFSHASFLS